MQELRGGAAPSRSVRSAGLATRHLAVVIPALNERENIPAVIDTIPVVELARSGYETEILVVDNGSTDGTGDIARECGARVVVQPVRGYGSAYKAGFANCTADLIATGDADLTYPFEVLPDILRMIDEHDLEFVSTNRLECLDPAAMAPSHVVGNRVLTAVSRVLFQGGFQDSQSGMWVFKRSIWDRLQVQSNGMAFSQELKNEAYVRGFKCAEVPITYRPRGGEVKLRAVRDGARNAGQLFAHRARAPRPPALPVARVALRSVPILQAVDVDVDLVALERELEATVADLTAVAAD